MILNNNATFSQAAKASLRVDAANHPLSNIQKIGVLLELLLMEEIPFPTTLDL